MSAETQFLQKLGVSAETVSVYSCAEIWFLQKRFVFAEKFPSIRLQKLLHKLFVIFSARWWRQTVRDIVTLFLFSFVLKTKSWPRFNPSSIRFQDPMAIWERAICTFHSFVWRVAVEAYGGKKHSGAHERHKWNTDTVMKVLSFETKGAPGCADHFGIGVIENGRNHTKL